MSCGCVDVAVIFRKVCVCLDGKADDLQYRIKISIDVNNDLKGGLVIVVAGDES